MTARVLNFTRLGHGPPLVLLHGFTGSARSMAGLARSLAGGFATISVDLPGHGDSRGYTGATGLSFDACIEDLAATLAAAGYGRACWLGYSMGARLALACAVRRPELVDALVLVSGRAGIADDAEREVRRRTDEALARRMESDGIAAFVDEWMAMPMFQTQQGLGAVFLEEQRRERMANDARELAASLRALGPGAQPPLYDQLSRVTMPVMLIAGALDPAFVAHAKDLAQRLPDAESCTIAGAGHAVHLEQPDAVAGAVHDFRRRAVDPARSSHSFSAQETGS